MPIDKQDVTLFQRAGREVFAVARRRLGYSQAEMGALLDLSQAQISRIEAGKTSPPLWSIMYFLHIWPVLVSELPEISTRTRAAIKDALATASPQALTSAYLALAPADTSVVPKHVRKVLPAPSKA